MVQVRRLSRRQLTRTVPPILVSTVTLAKVLVGQEVLEVFLVVEVVLVL